MPEAAVNEDSHLASGEDDVRTYPQVLQHDREVLPVAIAQSVQLLTKRDLGLRVRPLVCPHVAGSPLVRGGRIGPRLRCRNSSWGPRQGSHDAR